MNHTIMPHKYNQGNTCIYIVYSAGLLLLQVTTTTILWLSGFCLGLPG